MPQGGDRFATLVPRSRPSSAERRLIARRLSGADGDLAIPPRGPHPPQETLFRLPVTPATDQAVMCVPTFGKLAALALRGTIYDRCANSISAALSKGMSSPRALRISRPSGGLGHVSSRMRDVDDEDHAQGRHHGGGMPSLLQITASRASCFRPTRGRSRGRSTNSNIVTRLRRSLRWACRRSAYAGSGSAGFTEVVRPLGSSERPHEWSRRRQRCSHRADRRGKRIAGDRAGRDSTRTSTRVLACSHRGRPWSSAAEVGSSRLTCDAAASRRG